MWDNGEDPSSIRLARSGQEKGRKLWKGKRLVILFRPPTLSRLIILKQNASKKDDLSQKILFRQIPDGIVLGVGDVTW
jgi:hypothetical protein